MNFFLKYADTFGPFIPLIIILFSINKVPKRAFIMLGYLIITTLLYGYSNYLADRVINNMYLYHVICFIEFFFVAAFILSLNKSKMLRNIIYVSSVFFTIFFFTNLVYFEDFNTLNSNSISVEFLLLIIACSFYFYELMNSDHIFDFHKSGDFWIVAAFLFYFSGAFLSFALYKYAAKANRPFMFDFWNLQVILYFIKCLLISIGILCYRKK